ncbi:MAG: pantetheine-phosphate adenylyltransferase [Clostridiales bacterium]|nr:MAG: pantetheine-phosphate adenylyltransferase [Clostridiales bacterium]
MSERAAVCPGSYDPITLGHVDIINRACAMFDKVYVLVCNNSDKKYVFDIESRVDFCKCTFSGRKNIEVVRCEELVVDLYKKLEACAIIKGVRNSTDYQYEAEIAGINSMMGGNIETVFLPAKNELNCLSSKVVREFGKYGGDISKIVPQCIVNDISKILFKEKSL